MKYRTTIREIKDNYSAVQYVPYCALQHLLTYDNPVAYTCGVYGWNMDVYENDKFPGIAIATGHRPAGKEYLDWKEIKEYDKKAQRVMDDSSKSYAYRRGLVTRLRNNLFRKIQMAAWLSGADVRLSKRK